LIDATHLLRSQPSQTRAGSSGSGSPGPLSGHVLISDNSADGSQLLEYYSQPLVRRLAAVRW
jgi:hypothetical protein